MKKSVYFSESEFRRCTPSCEREQMQQSTLDMLDNIRRKAGIPLILNSAYRTPKWDKEHGHSGSGAHTKGYAADIRCKDSANKYKIVRAAMELGVPRIGVYENFIHVDNDPSLPQNVLWYGK